MFARSLLVIVLLSTAAGAEKRLPRQLSNVADTDEGLLRLTNDPLLARADRISGEEVSGFVAFTFDDGPNPVTTPVVVDALVKYNVPATFFIVTKHLTGPDAEARREVLRSTLAKGFLVASHTVTHRKLRRASPATLAAEIDESIRILAKETERPIGMFRAPFGAVDKRVRAWIKKRGLTEAVWSIDPRDWEAKKPEEAGPLRRKILQMIIDQDGGVVVMHDVKPITAEIVAGVLDDLEAENCERLATARTPIWPVSLHYFLTDDKKLRAVPDDVKKTTEAYQAALPARCAARPPPPPPMSPILSPLFLQCAPLCETDQGIDLSPLRSR